MKTPAKIEPFAVKDILQGDGVAISIKGTAHDKELGPVEFKGTFWVDGKMLTVSKAVPSNVFVSLLSRYFNCRHREVQWYLDSDRANPIQLRKCEHGYRASYDFDFGQHSESFCLTYDKDKGSLEIKTEIESTCWDR